MYFGDLFQFLGAAKSMVTAKLKYPL